MNRTVPFLAALLLTPLAALAAEPRRPSLFDIPSPIIFRGDATTACRDPAVVYHDGWFRLFFTLVKTEQDKRPFSYTAWSKSRDLAKWSEPAIITPRDQNLNYGSPGNIIRHGGEWVLCLQTYPRPHGEKYGNASARIWTMRSKDLETWGPPELLRVKGPDVPREKMGRMIDAYLLEDKDEPGKWWCFYKQNGVSMSWSRDLKTWTYAGHTPAGENACVIVDGGEYVLFHSPGNGIGVERSKDLKEWRDEGVLTLGQKTWPWAQGRLTAGFVLDLRREPAVGKALLLFHGSDFPENDPRGGFDNFASIGLAWSDDLKAWAWPGKEADVRLHADGKGWRLDKASIADPKRPRVLLIGDSILNGYLKAVVSALDGKAYVDAWVNPYNQSEYVNKLLAEVLEQGPYDVVHFNMGLHGWQKGRIKEGTLEPLTKAYVQVIKDKLPNAKLIWVSSTPVTVKGKPTELDPDINPIIIEHNRMAAKVMAEMNVPVNDFYSLLATTLELARGDQFHWKPEAYELLARMVTESVLRELGAPKPSGTK